MKYHIECTTQAVNRTVDGVTCNGVLELSSILEPYMNYLVVIALVITVLTVIGFKTVKSRVVERYNEI